MLLENNIFRFDGYTYKSYKGSFNNKDGREIGIFNNIITDSNGNLYVSTQGELYRLDYLHDIFVKEEDIPNGLIYIDNDSRKWVVTTDSISYFNDINELTKLEFSGRKLPLNTRTVVENSHNQDIYFFSSFGQIYKLNKEKSMIDDYLNISNLFDKGSLIGSQIRNNVLWMFTSKFSIIKIDLNTNRVILKYQKEDANNIKIRCSYVSNDNKAWIGTMSGLYIIDPETNQTEHHQNNQAAKFTIPHNSIWSISEDNQKNVWIGTYAGSAAYTNHYDKNIFKTYGLSTNGLNKSPVSGFAVDNNSIYISTEGGGINILNKSNNTFSYLTQSNGENSLSGDYTKPSVIDPSGNVWIPTYKEGLNKYNPQTKQFKNFRSQPNDNLSLLSNDIRKVVLEPDSGIWIVYQQHSQRISYLSFSDNKISHYSPESDNTTFSSSDYIFDIYRGNDGKLWMVSSNQLFSLNVTSKEFEQCTIPTVKNLNATSLCMDNDGIIWIGTIGNELIKYDPITKEFESFPNILHSEIAEMYSINWSDNYI